MQYYISLENKRLVRQCVSVFGLHRGDGGDGKRKEGKRSSSQQVNATKFPTCLIWKGKWNILKQNLAVTLSCYVHSFLCSSIILFGYHIAMLSALQYF